MGMFKIGEPFKNIQDYADYPHNRLYYNGKIIGKVITDHWQFRMISKGIKEGWLVKAELNPDYKSYNVQVTICSRKFFDRLSFQSTIVARNAIEAKSKAILSIIERYNLIGDSYDIEAEVATFQ